MPEKKPSFEAKEATRYFKHNWRQWYESGASSKDKQELDNIEKHLVPHITPELFDAIDEKIASNPKIFDGSGVNGSTIVLHNILDVVKGKSQSVGTVDYAIVRFFDDLERGKIHEVVGLPKPIITQEQIKRKLTPDSLLSNLKTEAPILLSSLREYEEMFGEPDKHTLGVSPEDALSELNKLDSSLMHKLCEKAGDWRLDSFANDKTSIGILLDNFRTHGVKPGSSDTRFFPRLIKAIHSGELMEWLEE